MTDEVGRHGNQQVRVVIQHSQDAVTTMAKQIPAAVLARNPLRTASVIMVNRKMPSVFRRSLAADCTAVPLRFEPARVFFARHSRSQFRSPVFRELPGTCLAVFRVILITGTMVRSKTSRASAYTRTVVLADRKPAVTAFHLDQSLLVPRNAQEVLNGTRGLGIAQ